MLGYREDLSFFDDDFLLVQQFKKTAFRHELSDHVEVLQLLLAIINTHAHIEHDVWVSQLVQHLDFLDEVFQALIERMRQ